MLGDRTVMATIAVKDMDQAKKFYEEKLGLKSEKGADEGGIMYKCGSSHIFVYESSFAGTNKATYAAWGVGDDLVKVVSELKSKGVKFEHYDKMPGVKREGDVHIMGSLHAAWFTDPDGNILNLVNQM